MASYYVGRNTIWVIARNYPRALLRDNLGAILGAQWRVAWDALCAWRGRAARRRLLGQIVGVLTWPRWWRHRARVTNNADSEYLATLLT